MHCDSLLFVAIRLVSMSCPGGRNRELELFLGLIVFIRVDWLSQDALEVCCVFAFS